jgi:hypothetical protein
MQIFDLKKAQTWGAQNTVRIATVIAFLARSLNIAAIYSQATADIGSVFGGVAEIKNLY